ncbi:MAG TPA: Holliday junction branch migration DNA helicase RuvB [Candidatus Polarisedimenticolia bacterium]|nr:Holliday junction branch migration DNA helicase RuvB [Candidatus Polarisedimenticolia bacterium]
MVSERLVAGDLLEEDSGFDNSLRPRSLADFPGQDKIKDNLQIGIQAAQKRGDPLDHILLYGPPGLGKTTLANIVASEMRVSIRTTSGPAIERAGDLAAILTNLQADDVLFIDELHRLPRIVEEVLYPAMEDYAIDIVIGRGPGARSVRLNLPRFTLIGATTRYALLSPPLRDRFGSVYRLDFYDVTTMQTIIQRNSRILDCPIEPAAASEIARRSRGTPRVANRLLKRVRDYAQVKGDGSINADLALQALDRLEVDELGLDEVDHKVLRSIVEKFDGGPVGLETLAASISEDSDTIMDVYEPFLLQLGFIQRTPRGRVATRHAYEHLKVDPPATRSTSQTSLFE